ncbi:TPA: hypothetical protein RFB63_003404 [Yersinia enterocolitica]|nr:hypothetical protein [Yersinia enterocolitica]
MKELDSFTVERLEEIIAEEGYSAMRSPKNDEVLALAAIALAAKSAEPVAWEVKGILCHSKEEADSYIGEPVPLYEAPQLNSPEIPDGWKLVPIEPTLAMLTLLGLTGSFESMLERYANMLDAAPERENG